MSKIGKHRKPILVVIFTIITVGLYGIYWFAITLEELRKYRGKGVSGVVPIGLIIINALIVIFLKSFFPELIYFPLVSLLFFVFYFFALPFLIENEINKIKKINKRWYLIGILPYTIFASYIIVMNCADALGNISLLMGVIVYLISFILVMLPYLLWIFLIQRKLNLLWSLNDISNSFAIPEMAGADKGVPEAFEKYRDEVK